MLRLFFFLLLLANVAFGAHLYLSATAPKEGVPQEINRDALKIVAVTDPAIAQRDASETKKLSETLAGAACVALGVKSGDATRAQAALGALNLGARLDSRTVEEFTRFGVSLPTQKDKRTAETLVANLKRAGIADVSVLSDNAISLGVFSSEETANRYLAEIRGKAGTQVANAVVVPRGSQLRETVFTIKAPDNSLVTKLSSIQRDFPASTLKAVACQP